MGLALRVRRLDANGDMMFGRGAANFAEASEATAQRIRTAPRLIQGEWFLSVNDGVPWYQPEDPNSPSNTGAKPIMGAPGGPDIGYAEAILKAYVLGLNGVESLTSFSTDFDHVTRHLAITVEGTDIDGGDFEVAFQDTGP